MPGRGGARSTTALLLAVVVSSLLAGAASGAGGPRDEQERLTPQDQGRARSVVIRRSDLGVGWVGKRSTSRDDEDLRCSYYDPDLSDLTITGRADSLDFSRTSQTALGMAQSDADVYATSAQLASAWRRVLRPAAIRCLRERIAEKLADELAQSAPGVTARVLSSGRLALPRLAPLTAAYRFVVRFDVDSTAGGAQQVDFTIDVIFLGRGRGVVSTILGSLPEPPARAFELSLARTISARLAKAFPARG